MARATTLLEAAYEHAPVIVVQRFAFADGSPLANTPIPAFSLECNRVRKGSLDALTLPYVDLKTDADGCIYLPVYNTVYRTTDMTWPHGYLVAWPTMGWFETRRKVAILPEATVAPEPGDFVADASAPGSPTTHAMLPGGDRVDLLAISPYPDPENNWWLADGTPSPRQYQPGEPDVSPWPTENGRRFIFRFAKPLADDDHLQFRFSAPTQSQTHYTTVRNQDLDKPYVLFTVFPTHPDRVSMRLGQTSGPWELVGSYDPTTRRRRVNFPLA